jgi:rhodanese-related sulfurtransferase
MVNGCFWDGCCVPMAPMSNLGTRCGQNPSGTSRKEPVMSQEISNAGEPLAAGPNELGYAGDVTPEQSQRWAERAEAVLIDVRTDAEREWVGYVPGAVPLAWKQWPGMEVNAKFDDELRAAVPAGGKVMFLCRSGVRSIAAAKRATELGLEAYNILEGFEGAPDAEGHRNTTGGWRVRGLPWKQN